MKDVRAIRNDLKYEPVYRLSRRELSRRIEGGDPESIANALYAAAQYNDDSHDNFQKRSNWPKIRASYTPQ